FPDVMAKAGYGFRQGQVSSAVNLSARLAETVGGTFTPENINKLVNNGTLTLKEGTWSIDQNKIPGRVNKFPKTRVQLQPKPVSGPQPVTVPDLPGNRPIVVTPTTTADQVVKTVISKKHIEAIKIHSPRELYKELNKFPEGSPQKIAANLIRANGLVKSGVYKGNVDEVKLTKDLNTYLMKPAVSQIAAKVHDSVFRQVTGLSKAEVVKQLKGKLLSPDAKAGVMAMSFDQRSKFINGLSEPLMTIDTKLAMDVHRGLTLELGQDPNTIHRAGRKKLEIYKAIRQKQAQGKPITAAEKELQTTVRQSADEVFRTVYSRARALTPTSIHTTKTYIKYLETPAGLENVIDLLTLFHRERFDPNAPNFKDKFLKAVNASNLPRDIETIFKRWAKAKGFLTVLNTLDAAWNVIAFGYSTADVIKKRNQGKKLSALEISTQVQETLAAIGAIGTTPTLFGQFFGAPRTVKTVAAVSEYTGIINTYKTSLAAMGGVLSQANAVKADALALDRRLIPMRKFLAEQQPLERSGAGVTPAVKKRLDETRKALDTFEPKLDALRKRSISLEKDFDVWKQGTQAAFNGMAKKRYDILRLTKGDPRYKAFQEINDQHHHWVSKPFNQFSEAAPAQGFSFSGTSTRPVFTQELYDHIDSSAMVSAENAARHAPSTANPLVRAISNSSRFATAMKVFALPYELSWLGFGVSSGIFANDLRKGGDKVGAGLNALQGAAFFGFGVPGTLSALTGLGIEIGAAGTAIVGAFTPPVAMFTAATAASVAVSNWARSKETGAALAKNAQRAEINNTGTNRVYALD
ncbi:hypothetical protein, partial [Amylibacter sp. SFDW26]|uniref:hypothetical protein n=1 Tax=Amylibacter sp. SFDW26 TaxID=2652722 RepID=UPI001869A388